MQLLIKYMNFQLLLVFLGFVLKDSHATEFFLCFCADIAAAKIFLGYLDGEVLAEARIKNERTNYIKDA